jgi:hypothetical protein
MNGGIPSLLVFTGTPSPLPYYLRRPTSEDGRVLWCSVMITPLVAFVYVSFVRIHSYGVALLIPLAAPVHIGRERFRVSSLVTPKWRRKAAGVSHVA